MNLQHIDTVRKTVAQGYGKKQRENLKFWAHDKFPEWYLEEIDRLSKKYRPIRYMPLDVPKFEVDKKEFVEWWDQEAIDIVRIAPDVAEIILSDPRMWSDTIRTIARQRARLDRQLAGRVKPIDPDDVDCGVPQLLEG